MKVKLQMLKIVALVLCFLCLPTPASAAGSVAVFPLQELGEGRNDANLPFTEILSERLAESGNRMIGLETVIAFMANNRIRSVGHLDTLNIFKVRRDLGAAFVLLGTVSQRKERPVPSMGLTLNLVRTSDARTIWSYIGSVSTGEERRVLGIGEPQSTAELQPLLLQEIKDRWPWQVINDEKSIGAINIDSVVLEPKYVRPGDAVRSRVRLRDIWPTGQAPRVFFKADEQLYPATVSEDGSTYEGVWLAGETNGRYPVTLLVEWPHYGRTETTLLGNYIVDGTPPLIELEFAGTTLFNGKPAFSHRLVIIPKLLVRKPLVGWRLAFSTESGSSLGTMEGDGNLPKGWTWFARDSFGSMEDGPYEVVVQVWDRAGNSAIASKSVLLSRTLPQVQLSVAANGEEMVVDLEHDGKVPLAFWQMEMWTKKGKILTYSEGRELPVSIDIELPSPEEGEEIQGFLLVQDVLGNRVRRKVQELLPKIGARAKAEAQEAEAEEKKAEGVSKSWVEEF